MSVCVFTLQELLNAISAAAVAGSGFSADISEWLQKEIVSPSNLASIWRSGAPAPHPATTIYALQLYASDPTPENWTI